uniref:Uncharacterized protein n=1 Tax=Picea sitchensis TaxID=3332 RepID=A9NPZ2_PICSI|nr:unknown [Picea sitchensis]
MVRVTDCGWQWALLWRQLGAEAAIGGQVLARSRLLFLVRLRFFLAKVVFMLSRASFRVHFGV